MTASQPTKTVVHPADRGQVVYLRPAAWTALSFHTDLLGQRCDDGTPWDGQVRLDRIAERAATDPILTQLVALAGRLAADVADPWSLTAEWAAATALVAEHNRIDPLPAYAPVAYSDDDTCRHGRSFATDCADCEI